jgi:hypothetical protein
MNQRKEIVSALALSCAVTFFGGGCVAESPDEDAADERGVVQGSDQAGPGAEKTGEATEKCGCGCGLGVGIGFLPGACLSPWFFWGSGFIPAPWLLSGCRGFSGWGGCF